MSRGAPAPAGALAGVGVDAVDVARFRRVLDRRPRFAARCFTESERSDAGGSADVAQSLAARFAAKEAVMKALRSGIGGFALTDVEVCRTTGKGATRNAPYLVLHGAAAELAGARGAGTFHLSLTHTDGVAIAFVVAEQAPCGAVLTREEMRAADAAALETVSHETLVQRAGTATAHAALRLLGGAYGRRVVVVVGKGSNGADGRVAASFLDRRGARVRVLEAAAARAGSPCRRATSWWTAPTAPGSAARTTRPAFRPAPASSPSTSPRASTPTVGRHRARPCRPTARSRSPR